MSRGCEIAPRACCARADRLDGVIAAGFAFVDAALLTDTPAPASVQTQTPNVEH
jgi:hypothetical protein